MTASNPILSVRNLKTGLRSRTQQAELVRGVSFNLKPGEILGVVGESGCGKSLTGYSLLGLLDPPLGIQGGEVLYGGQDLTKLSDRQLRAIRGNRIAMIFQDPMVALNPVLTIGEQMEEAVLAHRNVPRSHARAQAIEVLAMVGIPSPELRMGSYPHEFSGGMRQRVVIAAAFLNQPDVIIADEPTTALDVTIQSQILSEIQAMAEQRGTAVIWVTHDLALLSGLADRVLVMYAGEVVEAGETARIIDSPSHPYTRALIAALPVQGRDTLTALEGFPPNLAEGVTGCAFAPRCPQATALCHSTAPAVCGPEHSLARCHFPLSAAEVA